MAVAKVTEIIAGSPESFEEAIKTGISRATKTLKNVQGAWVKEQQVIIDDGKVVEFRVTIKVTFILED